MIGGGGSSDTSNKASQMQKMTHEQNLSHQTRPGSETPWPQTGLMLVAAGLALIVSACQTTPKVPASSVESQGVAGSKPQSGPSISDYICADRTRFTLTQDANPKQARLVFADGRTLTLPFLSGAGALNYGARGYLISGDPVTLNFTAPGRLVTRCAEVTDAK